MQRAACMCFFEISRAMFLPRIGKINSHLTKLSKIYRVTFFETQCITTTRTTSCLTCT